MNREDIKRSIDFWSSDLSSRELKSVYRMLFSDMSNNNFDLNRPGYNPSSRATYEKFYPSTANFYTTMSVGRALLLNPELVTPISKCNSKFALRKAPHREHFVCPSDFTFAQNEIDHNHL